MALKICILDTQNHILQPKTGERTYVVTACQGQAPWTPWQTPLTRLSIKTGSCEVLSNINTEFVSHHFPLCFHVLREICVSFCDCLLPACH